MKSVQPIDKTAPAKPHRPVYRMHRYFARRPYTLFRDLVSHYASTPSVILDPFCGGGVAVVEGVLQGHRAIGFDSNPLAVFVSKMELRPFSAEEFETALEGIVRAFNDASANLFSTVCRRCREDALVAWFEVSALVPCGGCKRQFSTTSATKVKPGQWKCPFCANTVPFSVSSDTAYKLVSLHYTCEHCDTTGTVAPSPRDRSRAGSLSGLLAREERHGLWIPSTEIPDCNMQRESALFKKGIARFRQLFSDRQLLALARLRRLILKSKPGVREWLLFAFSSTLRYTNRMVTRNPAWRGDRPLEWAKPGFWLPPVFLEANVIIEYQRRCAAISRGKKDFATSLGSLEVKEGKSSKALLSMHSPSFHVGLRSATHLPLPDQSIDLILTDPPYGSYVHYADLSNFWSVWLPELEGMGDIIDDREEAVIARKRFPRAKSHVDYQRILEKCFSECARVLRANSYLVMTFNNREPRAWAALLIAATKAGFELPDDGVVFSAGVPSYRHTAQSRRTGSVVGDFVLSFRKRLTSRIVRRDARRESRPVEDQFVETIAEILTDNGSLAPNELMTRLYSRMYSRLVNQIDDAVGAGEHATQALLSEFDSIRLLDSHQRQLLERHFRYRDGRWMLVEAV